MLFTLVVILFFVGIQIAIAGIGTRIIESFMIQEEFTYSEDFQELSEEEEKIVAMGGKVEILDENFHRIYPENGRQYTTEEIYALTNESLELENGSYSAVMVSTKNTSEKFYKMALLPSSMIEQNYQVELDLKRESLGILFVFTVGLLLTIVEYVLIVHFYSKNINRLIISPIKDLHLDMKRVEKADYNINSHTYNIIEINEMRNSFEEMTKQLSQYSSKIKKEEFLKNQIISELGHDIKNSITPIIGYANILKSKNGKDKHDLYIEKIIENCNDMEKMLQILVSYGKFSRPDYKLDLEKINITDYFRDIIVEKYDSLETHKTKQEISIPNKAIFLFIDSFEMKRAIINLLDNAISHNPVGSEVLLKLQESSNKVEIIIADNGNPISETLSKIIFEPFVRAKIDQSKGTHSGLGLSITKKIIEKHQGKIKLLQPYKQYTKAFVMELKK